MACVRNLTWSDPPVRARTVALDWTAPTFRFNDSISHSALPRLRDARIGVSAAESSQRALRSGNVPNN